MFSVLPEAIAVKTPHHAEQVVSELRSKKILAVDTETTGLSRIRDRAIILAISDGKKRFAIYPRCVPFFKDLLENPELKLIAHNANFDQWMLLNAGIDIDRYTERNHYRIYDTMVMHALIDDTLPHDLKSLAKNYLDIEMVPFKKVFGAQLRKRTLSELLLDPENEDVVVNYAALDAYATYKLFVKLREELLSIRTKSEVYPTMWDYYAHTELPFTKVLWHVERAGIKVNRDELLRQAPEIEQRLLKIQKWFGRSMNQLYVNLNSNDQMGALFFGILEYPPESHTEKGKPQLNKKALEKWARGGCEYATHLLEYRDLDKKLSTYISNLMGFIHVDERVHASFNQTGARTGRLSSSDPNLQNQPPYIRSAYIPEIGKSLFAADYAQLEMRILAHFSEDPTLCSAIHSGLDIHSSTAAKMFKVPYDAIKEARNKEDANEELSDYEHHLLKCRKGAKAINFGLMYGQGAGALSGTLSCSVDEARDLIRQYFAAFPNVTKYFKKAIAEAREEGICSTLLGRRRQVPGINSTIKADSAQAERKVKNSPIQGTAADITKMAMIKIWEDPLITASGARMVIQVHDEIVFEVPKEFVEDEEFNERIRNLMEHPFDFDLVVPLETTSKYGDTWLECK